MCIIFNRGHEDSNISIQDGHIGRSAALKMVKEALAVASSSMWARGSIAKTKSNGEK